MLKILAVVCLGCALVAGRLAWRYRPSLEAGWLGAIGMLSLATAIVLMQIPSR